MTAPDPRVVLDASAVLAYPFRERGGGTVEQVRAYAVLPTPTLAEVVYKSAAKGLRSDAATLTRDLGLLGVRFEPATPEDGTRRQPRRHPESRCRSAMASASQWPSVLS